MANGNGIDFEKKFGEKWAKMSADDKDMATYIAISETYAFMRKADQRISELPCQNCEDNKALSTVKVTSRTNIIVAVIGFASAAAGVLITGFMTGAFIK